jgi:dephospho-CoA kinase
MKKIGLTGGIGSGKSFIANIFEKLDVAVYYSDTEAKRLMNEHDGIRKALISLFGYEVYTEENTLNRNYLANKIFSNKELIASLNAIVHPVVRTDFNEWAEKQHGHYVLQESAILFEIGAYKLLNATILVVAPDELRIKRATQRDSVPPEEIMKRMNNQANQQELAKKADFIIYNNEKEMLLPQIIGIHQEIMKN